ncbi:hypothetical protein EYF80_007705 [Liparis tanakae]|uniref:Uncharacterized protein n=1 Tax=Liparis tanakae TaxID=230148 RepID=A0A4Z2IVM7_9TELE|nr:hypothetical protein EYF80_007705 [Liparis tanakae]
MPWPRENLYGSTPYSDLENQHDSLKRGWIGTTEPVPLDEAPNGPFRSPEGAGPSAAQLRKQFTETFAFHILLPTPSSKDTAEQRARLATITRGRANMMESVMEAACHTKPCKPRMDLTPGDNTLDSGPLGYGSIVLLGSRVKTSVTRNNALMATALSVPGPHKQVKGKSARNPAMTRG